MKRRAHKVFILLFILVSIAQRAGAEDFNLPYEDFKLPDLYDLKSVQWQHLDNLYSDTGYIHPEEYNKQVLHGAIADYLESKLTSLGVPQTAMTLTGAALIFAIGQDAKLNLNESKTMSLQFQDIKEADRAILYRLQYSW